MLKFCDTNLDMLQSSHLTSVSAQGRDLLILPIGAFEQHGAHLPLATDSLIADVLASALADISGGVRVPAIPVSCSHEHVGCGRTVSADAKAIFAYVESVILNAFENGFAQVAIVNGHGGNYFLQNIAQQANVAGPRVYLGPGRHVMEAAFQRAGIETSVSDDMHGGEYETSVLLAYHPELVAMDQAKDVPAKPRPLLTSLGMAEYTDTGIIGRPSLATSSKGKEVVRAISELMHADLQLLRKRL